MICTLCDTDKPETEFYRSGRGKLGFASRCKACCIVINSDPAKFAALLDEKQMRDNAWLDSYKLHPVPSVRGDWPADEEWRGIALYPGQYEVSNKGRVRSHWEHRRDEYFRRPIPLTLTPYQNPIGYQSVTLIDWCTGQKTTHHIHSLVCSAFKGPCPSANHVAGHRDGDPSNNTDGNLDWITYRENEDDKRRHGRSLNGEKNHNAKMTADAVRLLRRRWSEGATVVDLASEFPVSTTTAHKIAIGKAWKHVK